MERETHHDRILRHLKDYGSITSWEAFENYGITRLSAIIFTMRQVGYIIENERISKKNRYGQTVNFVKYILKECADE